MTTNEIFYKIFIDCDCTRTEFCKMLGYKTSQSNVSQWLNKKSELSLNQLLKFCNKLKIKLKIEIL